MHRITQAICCTFAALKVTLDVESLLSTEWRTDSEMGIFSTFAFLEVIPYTEFLLCKDRLSERVN